MTVPPGSDNFAFAACARQHFRIDEIAVADEARHETSGWIGIELLTGADLIDLTLAEDGDTVGEPQGLFLIVRDMRMVTPVS